MHGQGWIGRKSSDQPDRFVCVRPRYQGGRAKGRRGRVSDNGEFCGGMVLAASGAASRRLYLSIVWDSRLVFGKAQPREIEYRRLGAKSGKCSCVSGNSSGVLPNRVAIGRGPCTCAHNARGGVNMSVSERDARSYTVRDCVIDLMRRFGGTTIFGNPGSTELPLFRNFPRDFRYVLGLQEAVVVGMADGYAQAMRNASFVSLHSAAGVGNAMGVIFTAYKNRTPVVIMAGQQARSILPFEPFLFSANAVELPKPYVKWSVEPARACDVPLAISRAYYIAMTPPRGPV